MLFAKFDKLIENHSLTQICLLAKWFFSPDSGMYNVMLTHLTLLDTLACAWFITGWLGYTFLSEQSDIGRRGLIGWSHVHRLQWARHLLAREVRVTDASLVGNLMNCISFYANTTIYIIAGLFAILGTLDKLVDVAAELPFAKTGGRDVMEIKLLLLMAAFVFAYFKFTWSLRQMNLLSILIGAAPFGKVADNPELEAYAQRMSKINSYGGDEFNRGIRAYYFGLAALCWLLSAWLFLLATTLVVYVLYRRDFDSATLRALQDESLLQPRTPYSPKPTITSRETE